MKSLYQTSRYALRHARHKFDAIRNFGEAGAEAKDGHLPHSVVNPIATYSPWLADREFQVAYKVARANTLVDIYRCYDLWRLVPEAGKLPKGDVLEVGVWRGGTGCLMARQAELSGVAATFFLCDTFRGVVKAGDSDRNYAGGEHSDTSEGLVRALAGKLGLSNIEILAGIFPDDTANAIANRTFRMCHIDVDVYESGREILRWVWPRLVPGGIVVFDDYGFLSTGGITRLVNEERTNPDRVMIHNLNGHAVFIKTTT